MFPWYTSNDSHIPDRVKIETISSKDKRLIDYEPKEGSLGLFGWNTIPEQADKVHSLTCTYIVI